MSLQNDYNQMVATAYFNNRSEKNYNRYYDIYYKIAFNSAKRIFKNFDDAVLVANDVMIKMYRNENFEYDPDKPHVGYINRLSYTTAIRHKNKLSRREKPVSSDANYENILTDGSEFVDADHNIFSGSKDTLSHVLRIIKPEYRESISIILSGESYIDIAEELGLSHSGVKLRTFRARNCAKKNFAEIFNTINTIDGHKLPSNYTGEFTHNLNGKRIVVNFVNGELHGEYSVNYSSGIEITGKYKQGYKDGIWKYYAKNVLVATEEYEDDYLCVFMEYENDKVVDEYYMLDDL